MKKWLTGLFLLFVLAMVSVYILVPRTLVVSTYMPVNATASAAFRFLSEEARWKKWWPGTSGDSGAANSSAAPRFIFKASEFSIGRTYLHAVEIPVSDNNGIIPSTASVLSIAGDSAVIQWETSLDAGTSPDSRIRQYFRARQIKTAMSAVLSGLQKFLDNRENVYGQVLTKSSTTDTVLIATKCVFAHYPTTNDIYDQISLLRQYSSGHGASQTGSPIINIARSDSSGFLLMAALPVNKSLEGKGSIFARKMVPGKFIVSEVQGGPGRIEEAFAEIQNYFDDYKKVSMAIRFQALITDRRSQPDSNKWVTKLYAPVF